MLEIGMNGEQLLIVFDAAQMGMALAVELPW